MGKFDKNNNTKSGEKNTAFKTDKKSQFQFKEIDLRVKNGDFDAKISKSEVIWNGGSGIHFHTSIDPRLRREMDSEGVRHTYEGNDGIGMNRPDEAEIVTNPIAEMIVANNIIRTSAINRLNITYNVPGLATIPEGQVVGVWDNPTNDAILGRMIQEYRMQCHQVLLSHAKTEFDINHKERVKLIDKFDAMNRLYEKKKQEFLARQIKVVTILKKLLGKAVLVAIGDALGRRDFAEVRTILDQNYGGTDPGVRITQLQDYISRELTYFPAEMTFDGFCEQFNNCLPVLR